MSDLIVTSAAVDRCSELHERGLPHTNLVFSERDILRTAAVRGPTESIFLICLRALGRELWLRYGRRIRIRGNRNDQVCIAYRSLKSSEFADINARQAWANWRTIPRSLNGQLPNRPLAVVDLCCGIGDSSAVLAYYCPPGSRLLGLDANSDFLRVAQGRTYLDGRNRPVIVQFRQQSVLQTFCDVNDQPLADASIDLINASGAIGSHFDRRATRVLARECGRVIRSGGLATLDAGRDGTDAAELADIFASEGFRAVRHARSCPLDRFVQVCLRKES